MSIDAPQTANTASVQAGTTLPKLLSPKELASYLRKSHAWVERSRWDGSGPRFLKIGHHCFYREQDVAEWLNERQRTQTGAEQ